MTPHDHNKYIAWVFMAHAGFQVLMLAFVLFMMSLVLSAPPGPGPGGPPREFMMFIMGFMVVFQLLFIVPALVAAYGLLKQRSWARLASIIAAVVGAMNVPFGTAACVYAMWFFLGDTWKDVYAPSGQHEGDPRELSAALEQRWTGMATDEKGNITFNEVEPPDWR